MDLPEGFFDNYKNDTTFGEVYNVLHDNLPTNSIKRDKMSRILRYFSLRDDLLIYENLVCVPRVNIMDILHLIHDNQTGGHFGYAKTLARLVNFNWKHKAADVDDYCRGCRICQ